MPSATGTTPTPEAVADRLAIEEILYTHSRGLDRVDETLLASCYWEDASVDYGMFRGPASDFVPLVISALGQGYLLTRHALQNTLFEFGENSCNTETLVSAHHLQAPGDRDLHYLGRYLEIDPNAEHEEGEI